MTYEEYDINLDAKVAKTTNDESYEPCEAVKLLLTRMESNPQEFSFNKGSKWVDILQQIYQRRESSGNKHILVMLNDTEITMLWEKYVEAGKTQLHQEFIRRILAVDKPEFEKL